MKSFTDLIIGIRVNLCTCENW